MIHLALALISLLHATDFEEGEYLARAASCRECHTMRAGQAFAGGSPLKTDFGTFFTPNITPDEETGIGKWSEEDFVRALRYGRAPDGSFYFPSFPFRSFTKMTDDDMSKIWVYLRSQKAVVKRDRPHDIWRVVDHRWMNRAWQWAFIAIPGDDKEHNIAMAYGPFTPDSAHTESWNRGAYLTEAVLHCAECHTPRNFLGGPQYSQWLAGSELNFSGKTPPNITPDPFTGITWTREQWLEFLSSGIDPKGQSPGVEMALAVRAASGLTRDDREAVVEYLMSLKPVQRYPGGQQ